MASYLNGNYSHNFNSQPTILNSQANEADALLQISQKRRDHPDISGSVEVFEEPMFLDIGDEKSTKGRNETKFLAILSNASASNNNDSKIHQNTSYISSAKFTKWTGLIFVISFLFLSIFAAPAYATQIDYNHGITPLPDNAKCKEYTDFPGKVCCYHEDRPPLSGNAAFFDTTRDSNGVFSKPLSKEFTNKIFENYNICFYPIADVAQTCSAISNASKDGAKTVVFRAHGFGDGSGLSLGSEPYLTVDSDLSCMKDLTLDVILHSCSNGFGRSGHWNFANYLANTLSGGRIFSADRPIHYLDVTHTPNLDVKFRRDDSKISFLYKIQIGDTAAHCGDSIPPFKFCYKNNSAFTFEKFYNQVTREYEHVYPEDIFILRKAFWSLYNIEQLSESGVRWRTFINLIESGVSVNDWDTLVDQARLCPDPPHNPLNPAVGINSLRWFCRI